MYQRKVQKNRMENKGVLSTLKFILITTTMFVLILSAVVVTVLNMYKPTLKVTLNNKFLGYFANEEEFEDVYNTLVAEKKQLDPEVKVYLESEPAFEDAYIRDALIAKQNVYTALREEIKTEFTIYHVNINDKKEMTFNNKDDANKYVEDLKKEVPKVKSEVICEKVNALSEMTSLEVANNIFKDVVSRNKPVIVRQPTYYPPATTTSATASADIASVAAAQGGIWPTTTRYISSPYGWRGASMHTGIDLAGPRGLPIYAYKSGLVTFSGWNGNYGYMVKVDHGNGVSTWYAHSSQLLVNAGDTVSQGQTIALMGSTGWSTGSHLHFEIRINGGAVNPYPYIS
jgi:murein DD-endopeptidase MepM/ murein hydrolase activator NlpD